MQEHPRQTPHVTPSKATSPHPTEPAALRVYNFGLSTRLIPEAEYVVRGVRSSGPGGQNVNKVSSTAELRFSVRNSKSLTQDEKERLVDSLQNSPRFNTKSAEIVLTVSEQRDFHRNKEAVIEKLHALIRETLLLSIPREERFKGAGLKGRERRERESEQRKRAGRREGRGSGQDGW